MAKELKVNFTCDRCGAKTVSYSDDIPVGWLYVKEGYYERHYCNACVSQLVKLGLETEKKIEVTKEATLQQ